MLFSLSLPALRDDLADLPYGLFFFLPSKDHQLQDHDDNGNGGSLRFDCGQVK